MAKKNSKILFLIYFMATVCIASLIPFSNVESKEWGPWDKDSIYETEIDNLQSHRHKQNYVSKVTTFPIKLLISFFQNVISSVDGATCDFYPTCSAYAKQSLKKHGFFLGLAMASERVIRDHSPEGYDLIYKFGRYYVDDPLENNDFWFDKMKGRSR